LTSAVSTKLEVDDESESYVRPLQIETVPSVTTAFPFWENRRHGTDGRTDRRTGCNA